MVESVTSVNCSVLVFFLQMEEAFLIVEEPIQWDEFLWLFVFEKFFTKLPLVTVCCSSSQTACFSKPRVIRVLNKSNNDFEYSSECDGNYLKQENLEISKSETNLCITSIPDLIHAQDKFDCESSVESTGDDKISVLSSLEEYFSRYSITPQLQKEVFWEMELDSSVSLYHSHVFSFGGNSWRLVFGRYDNFYGMMLCNLSRTAKARVRCSFKLHGLLKPSIVKCSKRNLDFCGASPCFRGCTKFIMISDIWNYVDKDNIISLSACLLSDLGPDNELIGVDTSPRTDFNGITK